MRLHPLLTTCMVLAACLLLVGATTPGIAAVPQLINYQANLTSGGVPVTTQVSILFAVWDDPTAGLLLWSETQNVLPDAEGNIAVLLGSVSPVPDSAFAGIAYLSMTVGADPEMTPRQRLVSVPNAFKSQSVSGDFESSPGSITISADGGGAAKEGNLVDDPLFTVEATGATGIELYARGVKVPTVDVPEIKMGTDRIDNPAWDAETGTEYTRSLGTRRAVLNVGAAELTGDVFGIVQIQDQMDDQIQDQLTATALGILIQDQTNGMMQDQRADGNSIQDQTNGMIQDQTAGGNSIQDQTNGMIQDQTAGGNTMQEQTNDLIQDQTAGGNSIQDQTNGMIQDQTAGGNSMQDQVNGNIQDQTPYGNLIQDQTNDLIQDQTAAGNSIQDQTNGMIQDQTAGGNTMQDQIQDQIQDQTPAGNTIQDQTNTSSWSLSGLSYFAGGLAQKRGAAPLAGPSTSYGPNGIIFKDAGDVTVLDIGVDGVIRTHLDVVGNINASGNLTSGGNLIASGNLDNGGDIITLGKATIGPRHDASGSFSFVAGDSSGAFGNWATISGGKAHLATADFSTVGGGNGNWAAAAYSVVAGGRDLQANGLYSMVSGGHFSRANGDYSMVLGGHLNLASGLYSLAAGRRARADHDGAFVWGDATDASVVSERADQFRVRANGGARFDDDTAWVNLYDDGTDLISTSTGAHLTRGGAWTNSSDVNLKENFKDIDTKAILDRVASLPIQHWNYMAEGTDVDHVGPTAQDFFAAFGLGTDDVSISTVDADGVALAAIQALYQTTQTLNARTEELTEKTREIETLSARVAELQRIVEQLVADR